MSNSNLLAVFIGGAAAGAAIALLTAPQSGAESRKKILKMKNQSVESVEQLIEEGKKTWYETKGKAKTGVGIAADELDEFMRHILQKGERLWNKATHSATEFAENTEHTAERAAQNGKRTVNRMTNEAEGHLA